MSRPHRGRNVTDSLATAVHKGNAEAERRQLQYPLDGRAKMVGKRSDGCRNRHRHSNRRQALRRRHTMTAAFTQVIQRPLLPRPLRRPTVLVRLMMLFTFDTCHCPPRAVRTPRELSA